MCFDGVLQKRTPETLRWAQRTRTAQPLSGEPEAEPVVDLTDRRTDFQIINDLEETDGD